ncbi:MAG: ribonuclease R [Clostridium sp.]|nr:ribonuclease R [Clostridium sp.]MCM1444524.1 ribonuclease R [Candidatus Amulumruptor caecigallinarius]
MEQKILEMLKQNNKALSVYELNDNLGLSTVEDLKGLLKTLNKLEDEFKIYRTKKDKYMLFENSNIKVGKVIINKKGFGFVDIEGDEDVFVAPTNLNGAIHNDKVIVEITSSTGKGFEGRILKIVERTLKNMVGEFYYKQGKGYVDLDDEKVKLKIEIDKDKTKGAMNGHKVLVHVTSKIRDYEYKGEIVKILGHKNDPGVDILSIVAEYGINDTFSEKVMKEAMDLPNSIESEDIGNRKDLRNEMIFTIDGADTKDIDDAISLDILENGNYKLGVHIADVSYYVKENKEIDLEAYDRGTSVYLADRVIPMLPHKLSNGICSLNESEDRFAISCVMEIDSKGKVISYDIFESVIRSRKKMTYDNVNKILTENIVPEGYEDYADTLIKMNALAKILRKMKEDRGYIDFEIDEAKIIVDDEGKAIDVIKRERKDGEKLIEDFMIAANETVATHIYYMELPFVYRVHGEPSKEKINNFLKFISILGYKVTGEIKDVRPTTIKALLEQLKDKDEYQILSSMTLRSMQKAIYDKTNIGHFGLGSKCYTHFTSPIRRYPDLTVHRLLRKYLFKNQINKEVVEYYDNKLVDLTIHSSEKERDAAACEREVDDMKKAEFMMNHIGEEYDGMVSSVTSFGMFVELPNLVEGLVKIDDLKGGNYVYDEETFSIKSENDKRGYRLGDKVRIKVTSASKEARTIDFIIVKEEENGNK